jgi:hypothetical protein
VLVTAHTPDRWRIAIAAGAVAAVVFGSGWYPAAARVPAAHRPARPARCQPQNPDGIWGTGTHLVFLAAVAAVALVSTLAAAVIEIRTPPIGPL